MSKQRSRDTVVEVALRSELHRLGLRFRIHRRPVPALRREADVVFGPTRVAVFVDGCFWHGCPVHATSPRANGEWWAAKLAANMERDTDTTASLRAAGWAVIRVWEHEPAAEAASQVAAVVRSRRAGPVLS